MFDAIVLALSPYASTKLLGLTLVERGRRVAIKAGARRVHVIETEADVAALKAWAKDRGDAALVVLRAGDQLVHMPLIKPLIEAQGDRRIAVGADGAFAGALWAAGRHADEAVAAIVRSPASADQELAGAWTDAVRVEHGDIARHPATTKVEQRAAQRMLLSILVKSAEDSPVSKYIYRPLSRPLTVLLLHTPITANQVSYIVGLIGIGGCLITAWPSQNALIWGAALVFISGIIDGCDGEISRMKLTSSPFGAWLDTVIDEITQVCYFVAIGLHTYHHHSEPWVAGSIALGLVCFLSTIYAIYYFSIVVIKKGGSQYYVGDLELVDDTDGPALRPRIKVSTAPPWAKAIGQVVLYMIRRDFINLGALALAFFDLYVVIYGGIWLGTIVAAVIVVPEHLRLRRQLAELRRRGAALRYVSA